MRKVTIKDVADAAGVSYSTVSRALNGIDLVNSETKQLIINIAKEIGYRPNGIARSLVNKRSNTIALIVPDISNPFFADMALALEDAALSRGYTTLLCNTRWDPEIEERVLNMVEEKCVDGIIIKPSEYKPERIERITVPTVLLTHNIPEHISHVEVDNVKGSFLGCEHLIRCGYKRIAFIGGDRASNSNRDRVAGYKKALLQYDRRFESSLVRYGPFSVASGYNGASTLLSSENPPDAFVCGNDLLALGAWQRTKELGYDVPSEIGICGFDNSSIAELPQIRLTSIDQPRKQIGEYAAKMLIDVIQNRATADSLQKIILEPKLIKRTSTRDEIADF